MFEVQGPVVKFLEDELFRGRDWEKVHSQRLIDTRFIDLLFFLYPFFVLLPHSVVFPFLSLARATDYALSLHLFLLHFPLFSVCSDHFMVFLVSRWVPRHFGELVKTSSSL